MDNLSGIIGAGVAYSITKDLLKPKRRRRSSCKKKRR